MSRAHLKFLSGNYITYAVKAEQSGGSPKCRICNTGNNETLSHVILSCPSLEAERKPIITEYEQLCGMTKNNINFQLITEDPKHLCQFILDPSSMNLPVRVSISDPILSEMFKLSRDLCYKLDKTRTELILNQKQNK